MPLRDEHDELLELLGYDLDGDGEPDLAVFSPRARQPRPTGETVIMHKRHLRSQRPRGPRKSAEGAAFLRRSPRRPPSGAGRTDPLPPYTPDWVFSSAGRELAVGGVSRPGRKRVKNEAGQRLLPGGETPTMRARRLARFIESGERAATGAATARAGARAGAKAAGKGLLKTLGRAVPYVGGALLAADLASLAYGATAGADAAARAEEAALALDFLEDFGAEADIAREEALVEGLRNIERNERSLALTLAMEELDTQRELGELLVGREQSIARMARVAGQPTPAEVVAALQVLHPGR